MPCSLAELAGRGADLAALRLLARTDRSALAAALKELGYAKMGHRLELEKALLVEADSAEPEAGVAAAATTAAEDAEHCGKDEDEARVEKEVEVEAEVEKEVEEEVEVLEKVFHTDLRLEINWPNLWILLLSQQPARRTIIRFMNLQQPKSRVQPQQLASMGKLKRFM